VLAWALKTFSPRCRWFFHFSRYKRASVLHKRSHEHNPPPVRPDPSAPWFLVLGPFFHGEQGVSPPVLPPFPTKASCSVSPANFFWRLFFAVFHSLAFCPVSPFFPFWFYIRGRFLPPADPQFAFPPLLLLTSERSLLSGGDLPVFLRQTVLAFFIFGV